MAENLTHNSSVSYGGKAGLKLNAKSNTSDVHMQTVANTVSQLRCPVGVQRRVRGWSATNITVGPSDCISRAADCRPALFHSSSDLSICSYFYRSLDRSRPNESPTKSPPGPNDHSVVMRVLSPSHYSSQHIHIHLSLKQQQDSRVAASLPCRYSPSIAVCSVYRPDTFFFVGSV